MSLIENIFNSKKKRLYHIEINDEALDQEITQIIKNLNDKITEFKQNIDSMNVTNKEDLLQELYKLIINIKSRITHIQDDVNAITNIKIRNENYFMIKDKQFFEDKKQQLQKITEAMNGFITIVEQRPGTQELKNELISKMVNELNHIMESIKYVIADDKNLREIYKKISEV